MAPTVTVVIPVFNRPAQVDRAIRSVLAQTYQDFEIVVIDDGSTDETTAVVAAFEDPRITLIRHERNRGGSAARNTGIRAGTAPYIAFLDSDDEWLPTKLERQLEVFGRSGDQLGLVYTGADRVEADGTVQRHIPRAIANLPFALLTENVIGETSLGMVRRSAFDVTGVFDESLPAAQDMDMWLRLCERFSADFVPEALVRVVRGKSGRISVNAASGSAGREMFRRKHKAKLIQHRILHLHLRKSGWWYLREARDARQARRCFLQAIAARPTALRTYGMLLAASLPAAWVDGLAASKHRVSRLLPPARLARHSRSGTIVDA
jgi:glycosyltransferase involved in cell wall biosynthesis